MDGTTEDRHASAGGSKQKKVLDTIEQEVATRQDTAPQEDKVSRPKLTDVARKRVREVHEEVVA